LSINWIKKVEYILKVISNGSVTSPKGFLATGVHCGLKASKEKDLALLVSNTPAMASGVFTKNIVKGHSLQLTMQHIRGHKARAVVINSGNANACVGEKGFNDALNIARHTSSLIGCSPEEVLVGSTGVIGMPLNMEAIISGIEKGISKLDKNGGHDAEKAIMTTDTIPKVQSVEFDVDGKKSVIGGMAKGSGMIHPNMATMISIITTDLNISYDLMDKAFRQVADKTFNRISVDGDTSVCDMAIILSNGEAKNNCITIEDDNYKKFIEALEYVCTSLAVMLAGDGEGATKLLEITVKGSPTPNDALLIANAIAKSPLVKTMFFGQDANWGRIITAAGYSGAQFNPHLVDIYIGDLHVCKNGTAVNFDEEKATEILKQKDIQILLELNQGEFSDRVWTCDLSYDYVKINGSYRS
jgi:glutamate N-acetyltransferase/amino-acid N-acetyltransferase